MELPSKSRALTGSPSTFHPGLPVTEGAGIPIADCGELTEEKIRQIVNEFYRLARRDDRLGPVFERHVDEWGGHLARMTDFWSSVLLRSGRYSGNPLERHRAIDGLNHEHFDRWLGLFEATVRDLCSDREAGAFLDRARRMREAMSRALRPIG